MAPRKRQSGLIYVALLLAVTLTGGLSAIGMKVAQTQQQRSAEADLLAIGLEFRKALQSYAEATPNGLPNTPVTLTELRIYHDPFTGKAEWGIVRGSDQRILGIHSLSKTPTFKRENFPPELAALSGSQRHADWVFAVASLPGPQLDEKAIQVFSLK